MIGNSLEEFMVEVLREALVWKCLFNNIAILGKKSV